MFQKKFFFRQIMTILIAAAMLFSVSVLSAAADPGDGGEMIADDGAADSGSGDSPADDGGAADPGSGADIENGGVDNGMGADDNGADGNGTPVTPAPDEEQDHYEQIRENYINGIDDLDSYVSQYVPNANLDELPTVAQAEVVEATAEPLPDVEVSDATLFSGIVMWLCVAVGISVVAGVMVSKRTHRRGV